MKSILFILNNFYGYAGDSINESRIISAVANLNEIKKVYVFSLENIFNIISKRPSNLNTKTKVFIIPRIPSPHPIIYIILQIYYGYMFVFFSFILKKLGIIDFIYVREAFLAFSFVQMKKLLKNVSVKIVSLNAEKFYFLSNNARKLFYYAYYIETFVIRNSSVLFTVPGTFRTKLTIIRGNNNGIFELPQPVPIQQFSRAQKHAKFNHNDMFRVGYMGGLTPVNAVDIIIRAISIVQKEIPNVLLVIGGDGDLRYISYLRILIKQLNANVNLTLRIPNNKIPDVLKTLHLFLIPKSVEISCTNDVIPLKFIEAVAAGLPIIATRTTAIYKYLHGSNIEDLILVDDNDEHKWAHKIKSLIINKEFKNDIENTLLKHLNVYIQKHKPKKVAENLIKSMTSTFECV